MTEWSRVRSLFEQALDLGGNDRVAFLDEMCGSDAPLRARVERLLAADETHSGESAEIDGEIPLRLMPHELGESVVGSSIGGYRIRGVLGAGGMSTVFEAVQEHPHRTVALKTLRLDLLSEAALQRFGFESETLGRLTHPAIAQIYEAGAWREPLAGQRVPFFAMELVAGARGIDEYAGECGLDQRARLEMVALVCDAVHYGHLRGVIHRDLKPGNVLVDREGRPKIIDFGIARVTDAGLAAAPFRTEVGQVLGTLMYMAPEQLEGRPDLIDSRADVYALGVILYELLVGHPPHRPRDMSLTAFARYVRQHDPPLPSRSAEGVDRDLDWITCKAMAIEPDQRYRAVSELATDIRHFLAHEPVSAGPPTTSYVLRKFLRRNRVLVTATAAVLLTLLLGIAGTLFGLFEREQERREAVANLQKFDLLANVVRLREARAAIPRMYPLWPDCAPAMSAWITGVAEPLAGRLPDLRAERDALSERLASSPPAAAADGRMSRDQMRFLCDALGVLIADLESFAAPTGGELAIVREQLAWAERVEQLSIDRHRGRWDLARAALRAADGTVASAAYREHPVDLPPQMGLVPIGRNPATGLWEFYHLRTAADPTVIPVHAEDGALPVSEASGMVMVLIPGGTFTMGAQRDDAGHPNYDALAQSREGPPRRVTLSPFFLSRYEMTQAQWRRASGGETPSFYHAGQRPSGMEEVTWANPVESVTWERGQRVVAQLGLELPTEAQWEYACRAGSDAPWSAVRDALALDRVANLADHTLASVSREWSGTDDLDDGHVVHAPVGSFSDNAFGLHDMHGNVSEWCRDLWGPYADGMRAGDGFRASESPRGHVLRGGSFRAVPFAARSAARAVSKTQSYTVGVRASRRVVVDE